MRLIAFVLCPSLFSVALVAAMARIPEAPADLCARADVKCRAPSYSVPYTPSDPPSYQPRFRWRVR